MLRKRTLCSYSCDWAVTPKARAIATLVASKSRSEWVEQLDRKDRKFKKAAVQGSYEDWFMKTVSNAAEIYDYVERQEEDEPNLSYQFVYDFSPMLEESLTLGGYRLAYVLNTIFG